MFEIIKERPPFWNQLNMDGESMPDKECELTDDLLKTIAND